MIQAHMGPSAPGFPRTSNDEDVGPDSWGQWSERKHYSLEVVQHPIRARMCGFGDKDRRPLAPAAVAKMVVRTEERDIVDIDDIDCSFFLVTVDLWSADGKQEMNLVLHPSNSNSAPNAGPSFSANSRRSSKSGGSSSKSTHIPPSNTEPSAQPLQQPAPWSYHQEPQPPPVRNNMQYPPTVLPSISSFSRRTPEYDDSSSTLNTMSFRAWNADTPTVYSQPPALAMAPHLHLDPGPRQVFTRTLVGPLSSNATRLLDEHRKPGIFFLFQDLSIRTEGTFRLRLRLMNVGAPPAPEPGATMINTGTSPVLAQTFTEPFTVYSAKRFPGVPDTTALSIALGNQGQKLPLRNRNGSGSTNKKRRRGGGADAISEDEDDSD